MSQKLDELLQKKAKLERDIARAKTEMKRAARREDDRRKILAGAFVLAHQVKEPNELASWTINGKRFSEFLTRDDERALFGFGPLSAAPQQKNQPTEMKGEQA